MIIFAHRGSLTEAPENTLPSYKKAIERGAQAMEVDVQLTRDGHLVMHHDRLLKGRKISEYTLSEIKELDMSGSFFEEYNDVRMPTLEEVLDICPTSVLLNIEIKNDDFEDNGIELLVWNAMVKFGHVDNVIVSSFDHHCLKKFRELSPTVKIGLLLHENMLSPWDYAIKTGINPYSIHPYYPAVNAELVKESHKVGLKVVPFTVDDEKLVAELRGQGVDGVFSNNPMLF